MEAQILSYYEILAMASEKMLRAARRNELDEMTAAEAECATIITRLRCLGDGPALSADGQKRKMAIIRRVLADDAQIREATQPWLKRLEVLISGSATHKKLQGTYGGHENFSD